MRMNIGRSELAETRLQLDCVSWNLLNFLARDLAQMHLIVSETK